MRLYVIDWHDGELRLASALGKPMPNRQLLHDICQNPPFSNRLEFRTPIGVGKSTVPEPAGRMR
jgi:hypothetical protein